MKATAWWQAPSLCFGPMFMVLGPKLVGDDTLAGMAFIVVGLTMQTCVNLYLFRKVRETDATLNPATEAVRRAM